MTTAFNVRAAPLPRPRRHEPCARARGSGALDRPGQRRHRPSRGPDDDAIDAQIWIFDLHGRIEAPPSASKALKREAAPWPAARARTIDASIPASMRRRSSRTACAAARSSPASDCGTTSETARTSLLGSIAFALLLFGLVLVASRWLLRRALQPVARDDARRRRLERARTTSPLRTRRAARRAHEPGSHPRQPARAPRPQPAARAALLRRDVARAAHAARAHPGRGRARARARAHAGRASRGARGDRREAQSR